jgi:hypothetical protein
MGIPFWEPVATGGNYQWPLALSIAHFGRKQRIEIVIEFSGLPQSYEWRTFVYLSVTLIQY